MGDLGNKFDDMKGRAKEAVGDVTDDDGLKREGKVDRAGASVKDKVDDVKDKVGDMLNRDK
ncbi:MAG TPA: CsbD family protein [Acidimicrobiales bacterium]|nr:CsbD family protein [Acidimicrobiales bacterium]